MRALLWMVLVAFAGWSGWWWFASTSAKSAAEESFVAARAQGWQAGHGGIAVAGYPSRVDLTVTRPDLTDPSGEWGWQAPFLQVFALSYKPWHLIAALPNSQNLLTPLGRFGLEAAKLQASLVVTPGRNLTLERSQLVGESLALQGDFGQISAARLSLASRPALATLNAHDIGLDLEGLSLPPALQARLPQELFPAAGLALHVEAEAAFDGPLDRHALVTPPQLSGLTFRPSTLSWGAARVTASGALVPDAQGLAEGQLLLEITGGLEVLRAAEALQMIDRGTLRRMEVMVAMAGGEHRSLSLPLSFAGGAMRLGPFEIGRAPRLR